MTIVAEGKEKEVEFYSNGKEVLIAMGDSTYILNDVMLESICMNMNGLYSTEIDLKLIVFGGMELTDKVNLSDFKSANKLSIEELFKVINKKLNKRGEKNGQKG